jgi:hypothetical protein
MATSVNTLVTRLEEAAHRFGSGAGAEKHDIVTALVARPIRRASLLLRYHEALDFLRAHPDDAAVLRAVQSELAGFHRRVAALTKREATRLDATGVAGTRIDCPLSYPAARWLVSRFPGSVALDWSDPELEPGLAAVLSAVVEGLAEDALVEVGVPVRTWLATASAGEPRGELAWLLDRIGRRGATARALYDRAEPRLLWDLGAGPGSRTAAAVPVRAAFFHRGALRGRGGPLARRLPGPPVPIRPASRSEAAGLLDTARAAVTVRYREVHGFNYADPDDVVVAEAGRGVAIAWFGVLPEHRLPLRAHYGYLVLKNGVPIGYGDASLLFDWCEIAVNVFETFRRGESGFVFARLLASLCQWLGVRAFHLSPYQLGHDNDEALDSGAFWFYYKLGFRPVRPDLARLAREEQARLVRTPGTRSPRAMLARLATDRMVLSLKAVDPAVRDFEARRVAWRSARSAARPGDIARALGASGWRAWPTAEQRAFRRLVSTLAQISDLARWSARDRRALVEIVRAKGGHHEADYLRRMQVHRRLRRALLRLGGA